MKKKCRRLVPALGMSALVFLAGSLWGRQTPQSQVGQTQVGQTQVGQTQAGRTQVGLESAWDVRNILADLIKDNEELQPLFAHLNPQQWYDQKGAPGTYISQWQLAQRQITDVVTISKRLAQDTENLPLALDDYFRLEALEVSARSVEEGAQKYGDRATADRLSELIAHNFNSRQKFRDYVRDLAASNQQTCKIADEEAQRCRGMISREPPRTSKRSTKY